ncbi:MAG: helix-turn-helix domain-containing protein [Candidatus Omnitrophica bacterium]|nr:helix-turn-helix domain-containing protein [Candidatus Omnitrophota bacterium]
MDTPKKDKDFSKLPHSLIDSGLVAKVKPSVLKVFLVINRFANYETGLSYPTVKIISELFGVNKSNIAPATKQLALLGLIEKKKRVKGFPLEIVTELLKIPQ